jgi:hypothetical protein
MDLLVLGRAVAVLTNRTSRAAARRSSVRVDVLLARAADGRRAGWCIRARWLLLATLLVAPPHDLSRDGPAGHGTRFQHDPSTRPGLCLAAAGGRTLQRSSATPPPGDGHRPRGGDRTAAAAQRPRSHGCSPRRTSRTRRPTRGRRSGCRRRPGRPRSPAAARRIGRGTCPLPGGRGRIEHCRNASTSAGYGTRVGLEEALLAHLPRRTVVAAPGSRGSARPRGRPARS